MLYFYVMYLTFYIYILLQKTWPYPKKNQISVQKLFLDSYATYL